MKVNDEMREMLRDQFFMALNDETATEAACMKGVIMILKDAGKDADSILNIIIMRLDELIARSPEAAGEVISNLKKEVKKRHGVDL